MSMDFDTVVYAMEIILPAAFVMGSLGYIMGRIFEEAKKNKDGKNDKSKNKIDSDLLIDDLLVDDLEKIKNANSL